MVACAELSWTCVCLGVYYAISRWLLAFVLWDALTTYQRLEEWRLEAHNQGASLPPDCIQLPVFGSLWGGKRKGTLCGLLLKDLVVTLPVTATKIIDKKQASWFWLAVGGDSVHHSWEGLGAGTRGISSHCVSFQEAGRGCGQGYQVSRCVPVTHSSSKSSSLIGATVFPNSKERFKHWVCGGHFRFRPEQALNICHDSLS